MKVVCIGILLVIALVAIAAIAVMVYALAFFDPNNLKPRIVSAVRERTGMTLVMDGNISWRFYPHIGFSIDSVKAYASDQSIMNGSQASVRHADISLRLSRLLMGDVIVDGLNVQGVRVNLLCDDHHRQSCLSWLGGLRSVLATSMPMLPHPFLVEASHMGKVPISAKNSALAKRFDGSMPVPPCSWPCIIFDLDRVKIEDGEVHYLGAKDGFVPRVDINQLTLVGAHAAFGRSFPISVTFDVASGTRYPPATITAQASVRSDLLIGLHEVDHLRLAALSGDNRYSMSVGHLKADTDHDEYQVTDVHLDGIWHGLLAEGEHSPFSLVFNGRYDGLTDKATMDGLTLSLLGLNAKGHVEGLNLFGAPHWKGAVNLSTTNLRQWLATNGLAMLPDAGRAFRQGYADIDFSADEQHMALDSVKGNLDGQVFSASLQWPFDGTPAAEVDVPELSLDRYLPLDTGVLPTLRERTSRDMTMPAWVDWLMRHRALAFQLRADVDTLHWHDLAFRNVSLLLSSQHGDWRLSRLAALLGSGQIAVTGGVQAGQVPGKLFLTSVLRDIPLHANGDAANAPGPLPTLSGRLELGAQLNDPWGTLSGPVTLSLDHDDRIGTWLSHSICRAAAQVNNTPTDEVVPAALEHFNGRFTLRDGILYSDDLRGRLSGNLLEGEGIFDVARHRFDYRLLLRPQFAAAMGCALPREMVSSGVPLHCAGALEDIADGWCGLDDERSSSMLTPPSFHLAR